MSKVIDANSMYDPDQDVRAQGTALAECVSNALKASDDRIIVSFKGVRGAASSYFNVFLHRVAQDSGVQSILNRLHFEFGSTPQKLIFDRSRAAVVKEFQN